MGFCETKFHTRTNFCTINLSRSDRSTTRNFVDYFSSNSHINLLHLYIDESTYNCICTLVLPTILETLE